MEGGKRKSADNITPAEAAVEKLKLELEAALALGEIKGKAKSKRAEKQANKEGLSVKWEELKKLKAEIKNEDDEEKKDLLLKQGEILRQEVKELYVEETGKELEEAIKEKVASKNGNRFMKAQEYEERLEGGITVVPKAEKEKIKKEVREKRWKDVIEKKWEGFSSRKQKKYRNEEGEVDIKEYERELNDKRDAANKELERHGIALSKDVFYELIDKGYKPQEIKGKILEKEQGRIVALTVGGVVGAGSAISFGLLGGILGVGCVAVGGFGEKLFSKRLYGGVKLPDKKHKNATLSQEDFELLLLKMQREAAESIQELTQEKLDEISELRKQEIAEKIKKGKEKFNQMKDEAFDELVDQVTKLKGKKTGKPVKDDEDIERREIIKNTQTLDELYELLGAQERQVINSAREMVGDLFDEFEGEKDNKELKAKLEETLGSGKSNKENNPLYGILDVGLRNHIRILLSAEIRQKFQDKAFEQSQDFRQELVERGFLFSDEVWRAAIDQGCDLQNAQLKIWGLGQAVRITIEFNMKGKKLKLSVDEFKELMEEMEDGGNGKKGEAGQGAGEETKDLEKERELRKEAKDFFDKINSEDVKNLD